MAFSHASMADLQARDAVGGKSPLGSKPRGPRDEGPRPEHMQAGLDQQPRTFRNSYIASDLFTVVSRSMRDPRELWQYSR